MSKRPLFLLLVALAVFVPTGIHLWQYTSLNYQINKEPVFRVPVGGFDPRDIARGRYATLQINWTPDHVHDACKGSEYDNTPRADCGICLLKTSDEKTTINIIPVIPNDPAFANICQKFIHPIEVYPQMDNENKIGAAYRSKGMNIKKFFLDESIANRVDESLNNRDIKFSADVVFVGDDLFIRELYMNGEPHHAFIQALPEAKPGAEAVDQAVVPEIPEEIAVEPAK